MNKRGLIFLTTSLLFILACNASAASTPELNLLATLSASTPRSGKPTAAAVLTPTSAFNFPTSIPSTFSAPTSASTMQPKGQIVFTCQIYKTQGVDQICIVNADGTGFRRLTTDDGKKHYYPSLAPDGKSVVYAAFREANIFEIYEMHLAAAAATQLTNKLGNLNAPEISPDGKFIVFKMWNPKLNKDIMEIMERNGKNVERFTKIAGWDPTWSPDGQSILFASDVGGTVQLYSSLLDGTNLHRISALPSMRGRSDWSPDGKYIATYAGEAWKHEAYIMDANGLNARVISPVGGNSQGPSFSPDGQWIAFTAYFDHYGDENGCEIYILRVDGSDLRRLTNNDYCDYQPRWGP